MTSHARTIAALAAAGALLALPAIGSAQRPAEPDSPGRPGGCATVPTVPFEVNGRFVDMSSDTVTLRVTSANRHATDSGELADQSARRPGRQVRGARYTVPGGDPFTLRLVGYGAEERPAPGDRVRVTGRIPLKQRRCVGRRTSTADRYLVPDVRRVTIVYRDPPRVAS